MRVLYDHELDGVGYVRDHGEPEEPARTVYEHYLRTCPEDALERYARPDPLPTVSVIVTHPEGGRGLERTLESVVRQIGVSFECIVVDDASSDGSLEHIKKACHRDDRLRLLRHRAPGGSASAKNSGLRSARGTFVSFLRSGDELAPSSLAIRLEALASAKARVVGAVCAAGLVVPDRVGFADVGGAPPFELAEVLARTAFVRDLGGFDETCAAEDAELLARALRHGGVIQRVPGPAPLALAAPDRDREPLTMLRAIVEVQREAAQPLEPERARASVAPVHRSGWPTLRRARFAARAIRDTWREANAPTRAALIAVAADALAELDRDLAIEEDLPEPIVNALAPLAPLAPERPVDVAFLPHKDYHVWTFSLLLPRLREAGVSHVFVDLTTVYRDERARQTLDALGLESISYNAFLLGRSRPRMVVCMNDWDAINRRIVESCHALGIPTVGIVEGIQDYLDADTGRVRAPYRTVDHVVLPGAFDARYFEDDPSRVRVGGVPRIDELLAEDARFPSAPRVVINSNFTYGVLLDARDAFVRSAVEACDELGLDYVISRHPADRGDLSAYRVGEGSMYELIREGSVFVSRFGSGILEALAMGKPIVYYNPHGERVDKFTEPGGAFPIARTKDALKKALSATIEDPQRFLRHADTYLELHCGASRSSERPARERVADAVLDLYRSVPTPSDARRARLHPLLVHRDEALLGALAPGFDPDMLGEVAEVIDGEARRPPATRDRVERLRRKAEKLRRDPRAFFAHSRIAPLRALRHLFGSEEGGAR